MTTRSHPLLLLLSAPLLVAGCSDKGVTVHTEPPAVSIANPPNNGEVDEGVLILMVGKIKDAAYAEALDSLSVYWSVDGAAVCADAAVDPNGDTVCDYTFLSAGAATVSLSVTNPDSETASATSTVNVLANAAPSIALSAPDINGTYYSDQLISFEATAEDAEDAEDALSIAWISSLDGTLSELPTAPTSDGNISGATQLSAGEHLITATVTDTTGRTGSDAVTLTVGGPNTLPSCDITAPLTGEAFSAGASVDFEATADDPDIPSSELEVTWESDRDGPLGSSNVPSDGQITFSTDALSSGTHTISLIVADEVGGECTDTVRIQIGDEPFVTLDTPSTGEVYNEGESIIFQASVSDANDDVTELSFSWESSVDGVISTQGAGSSGEATFAYSTLSVGPHTLGVTVTDPLGFSGYDSATFTINGLPGVPGVSLSPDPPQTGDDLQAVVDTEATDPEGDAITYSYTWKKNGVATADISSQIVAGDTARGDTWEVTVTASDPYGAGGSASASATVVNSPPALADVALSPDPAGIDDTLTCAPGLSTDADGDAVSYRTAWTVNSVSLSATTTTLSGAFSSGDDVACVVTPTDGLDDGAAVSSNVVTIDNSPPSLDSASLAPATAYEDTTLVCTAGTGADTDGDTVSFLYSWWVDGLTVAGASADSLTGADFDRDSEVYCRVTPFDGSDYGAAADSNTVTIHNTPPELDGATLGPDPVYTSDSLTCTPGATSDLDGDSVSVAYQWEVNGAVEPVTGAVLSSSYTARGDIIACTLTPSDGSDDGLAVASGTLTVSNTAPSVSSLSLSPASPTSEDTLTATPVGSADPDGDSISYTYAWFINGAELAGVSGSTLDGGYLGTGDTISAQVTPSDGIEDGATVSSSSVTVGNSAPVIGSVSLSPTTAYETSSLLCTVDSASDTDGDSISYQYGWIVGGAGLGVTTETLEGAYFSKGDTVACTATPSDGLSTGAEVDSNEVLILNSPPSLDSVSVSPDPAYTDSSLTCAYSGAADDDGDTVSVSYLWEVNGAEVGSSSVLSSTNFSKGDAVVCTVTPTDGDDVGAAISSGALTISNSLPSALSATLDPATAYTDDDIAVEVSGWSDLDGDSEGYLYAWSINGASAGSSASLSSSSTARGDTVYVVVTPYDGTGTGAAVTSSTITVQNSAPTAPGISVSPAAPQPEDNLSCNIDAASTDADSGDSVSYVYSWTVDGVSTGFVTTSIASGETSHGETWACTVYATDGAASSATVTDSVNINDGTAPNAPVLGDPSRYTNEDEITLSGTCEASCGLIFYLSDDAGSWSETDTCTAAGGFSHTVYPTRGYTTQVYATCTDEAGNTSGFSNTAVWEVCDPVDEYDWSAGGFTDGYGDSLSFLIDEWSGRLTDTDGDSLTVTGNILEGTDEDWYLFYVADGGHASGSDYDNYYENYNFEVNLSQGGSDYNFYIYSYDGASAYELATADKVTGGTCDYSSDGFDDFDWYSYDSTWSDTRTCRDGEIYSDCPDYSSYWVVEVVKDVSAAASCQNYELTLSNGIW